MIYFPLFLCSFVPQDFSWRHPRDARTHRVTPNLRWAHAIKKKTPRQGAHPQRIRDWQSACRKCGPLLGPGTWVESFHWCFREEALHFGVQHFDPQLLGDFKTLPSCCPKMTPQKFHQPPLPALASTRQCSWGCRSLARPYSKLSLPRLNTSIPYAAWVISPFSITFPPSFWGIGTTDQNFIAISNTTHFATSLLGFYSVSPF